VGFGYRRAVTSEPSLPRRVAVVGHRLGAPDGISAASAVWQEVLRRLGVEVTTVAGQGVADHLVAGLAHDASGLARESPGPVDEGQLETVLAEHDLVVVENVLSAPGPAAEALERVLSGRPAILRHHDLAWQRSGATASDVTPPTDPAWRHVTINERSRIQLTARGVPAEAVYHHFFAETVTGGDRSSVRERLGLGPEDRLLLQPTRATAAKNVAGGLLLAAGLDATYWLLGHAEEGYGPELDALIERASVRVLVGPEPGGGEPVSLADAYAAADAVVLPSTWEGFGNATIEAAFAERPIAVGGYPVAAELRRYGFSWFDCRDPAPLARQLADPNAFVIERNVLVARVRFSADDLADRLIPLLTPGRAQ
jgi:glycosyltransferase involved in cell wall biosynthesis